MINFSYTVNLLKLEIDLYFWSQTFIDSSWSSWSRGLNFLRFRSAFGSVLNGLVSNAILLRRSSRWSWSYFGLILLFLFVFRLLCCIILCCSSLLLLSILLAIRLCSIVRRLGKWHWEVRSCLVYQRVYLVLVRSFGWCAPRYRYSHASVFAQTPRLAQIIAAERAAGKGLTLSGSSPPRGSTPGGLARSWGRSAHASWLSCQVFVH